MSIVSTGLHFAGKGLNVFRKSVLCTKPQNVANININKLKYIQNTGEDVFELKNTATKINLQLKKVYDIESEISNPEISKRVLSTVEDYCSVNKNNKLFSGAKIKQDFLDNVDNPYQASWDYNTNKMDIIFNENFNWRNSKQISQILYDECTIPVNHPNFFIYKTMANILNFKHNPYAFVNNINRNFINRSELDVFRLSNQTNVEDFNANYIVARMFGKDFPKGIKNIFAENGGNINVKLPKPVPTKIIQGSIHHFKNQKDAINYLNKNYGIEANFINTNQANLFASAVDDLSKALGSNEYFRGLKVLVDPENFDDLTTKMSMNWNMKTGEAYISINPAYNWKNAKKLAIKDYNCLYHSNPSQKDAYLHELLHWLDFNGNPTKYGETEIAFSSGKTYYNQTGKSITAKVSSYAPNSPAEFRAEYASARINGFKFPKAVDNEFESGWNGPILNFPD